MRKLIEIILIVLTISLSLTLSYYQINKIEGTALVFISVYGALTLLSIFYLIGFKNKYGLIIQTIFIIGLLSSISNFYHWPGGFMTILINISMITCSILCIPAKQIKKKLTLDNYLLYAVGISLFLYGALTLSNIELIYTIGRYFNYANILLILTYLTLRKDKSFPFNNNLKSFLIFTIVSTISYLRYFLE